MFIRVSGERLVLGETVLGGSSVPSQIPVLGNPIEISGVFKHPEGKNKQLS